MRLAALQQAGEMALTLNEYNRFCRSLPQTTSVVQWGGAHVWKVGAKVFAIARENQGDHELYVTFKCSALSYDMLKDMSGCRPAPYLASRGMKWIQRTSAEHLDDAGLKDYLRASYDQVIKGLPKRMQQELGLAEAAEIQKSRPAAAKARPRAQATQQTKSRHPATPQTKSTSEFKSKSKAKAKTTTPRKGAASPKGTRT